MPAQTLPSEPIGKLCLASGSDALDHTGVGVLSDAVMYRVDEGEAQVVVYDRNGLHAAEASTRLLGPASDALLLPPGQEHIVTATSAAATILFARFPQALPRKSFHGRGEEEAKLTERDAALRRYVDATREDLRALANATDDLTDDLRAALIDLQEREGRARAAVACAQLERAESMRRHSCVAVEETSSFASLLAAKRAALLVPWCNNGCNYCCMTRNRWESHVEAAHDKLREDVTRYEQCERVAIESERHETFSALVSQLAVCIELRRMHGHQRAMVGASEAGHRGAIVAEEAPEFQRFVAQWTEIERNKRLLVESGELRERYLAVAKVQDGLALQERRVLRRLHVLLSEEERTSRLHLLESEEVRIVDINNRFARGRDEILFAQWKRGVEHVLRERDELVAFRKQVDDEKQAAVVAAARAEQEALENEFKEVKKLKKAGPPKVPEVPPCARCGHVPQKDAFTHRTAECAERPVQCAKCEKIITFSSQEAHKAICPSRVLQCEGCGNHYKASYLEIVHAPKCAVIRDLREQIVQLHPTFPFDVAPAAAAAAGKKRSSVAGSDGGVGGGVPIKFSAGTPAHAVVVSAYSSDTWVNNRADLWELVALAKPPPPLQQQLPDANAAAALVTSDVVAALEASQAAITTPDDVRLFLAANADAWLRIGEPIAALLQPIEVHAPQPPSASPADRSLNASAAGSVSGGELTAPTRHRQWCLLPMATRVSLLEYREMLFTVQSDEANYCKPQPAPAAKKGGATPGKK